MTTALLFPGQGSQTPGMGHAFYKQWPTTQQQFDTLAALTDWSLHELCFQASAETFQPTLVAQPALYTVELAVAAGVVNRLGPPEFVAGHSLGHMTALAAAGTMTPEDGFALVSRRGELMHAAAHTASTGTMVAILLVDPDTVSTVCAEYPRVCVAGYNAPRQTVISGPSEAVAAVRTTLESRARPRFIDLDVSAAFHSPAMSPVTDPLAVALDATPMQSASIPICSDISTTVYTTPDTARADLRAQVTAPIDWVGVIETLANRGVDQVIELPPAGTLTDLTERIAPDIDTVALTTPEDLRLIDA